MSKSELDSILLVNLYFTNCRVQKPNSVRTEMVRKYLTKRIDNILTEKAINSNNYLLSSKLLLLVTLLIIL